jgi:ureidoglycolate lyase
MTGVTITPVMPRAIDRDAFAPFGQLLESPGEGSRLDFAGAVGNGQQDARPNLALIRARPAPERLRIAELECHPYSSQAFFPLDVDRYLVIVCKDDGTGSPDLSSLVAFRVKGTQAINYDVGTWHYGMATIGRPGLFAMLVFENGSPDDCHFRSIAPVEVSL